MARIKQKRKQRSKIGIVSMSLVVLMLSFVLAFKSRELELQIKQYQEKEASVQKLLTQEQNRAEELEEYLTYMQTKQYIEEVAREKLGLVYPDEILLKPE